MLVIQQKQYFDVGVGFGISVVVGVGVDVGIGVGVVVGFGNGVVVAFGISVGVGLSVNIDVGSDVSIGVGDAGHVETVTTRRRRRRHRESLLPFRPKSKENLHEANKRRSEGMNRPSSIHTSAGAVILLLPIYTSLSQSLC